MNRKTGLKGEEQARAYLKSKGYEILESNFRVRAGEIDIIALKGQTVAFVEVKARRSKIFGGALSALPQKRIERLRNASSVYLSLHEERWRWLADVM